MTRKWTLFYFGTGDFKGVEAYLNSQAAKGWELERAGWLLARWRRTERHDLRWCVDLTNPRQPREEREEYLELCSDCGWNLALLTNNMYLFKSRPGQVPIPVQTDPVIERKVYNKYYLRSIILSAIYIAALLAFYGMLFLMTEAGGVLDAMRYEWAESWTLTALLFCLPVWGVYALWKIGHFVGALIRNRGGVIGTTPAWAMWANSALSAVTLLMGLVLLLGLALDMILTDMDSINLYVMLGIYGIVALYRTIEIEREQFSGEKRRTLTVGLCLVAALIVLIVADVRSPYGEWSSYGRDEKGLEKYEQTLDLPIVRSEDLGLPIQLEENDFVMITHAMTPMGEGWEVENFFKGGSLNHISCAAYTSPTLWQAKLLARTKATEVAQVVKYNLHSISPGVEVVPIKLDWADEAWYGEDGIKAVLLVRIGRQTSRVLGSANALSDEAMPAIQARLAK